MKRESILWENIFANDTSDKGLIPKIYTYMTPHQEDKKSNLKMNKGLNRH